MVFAISAYRDVNEILTDDGPFLDAVETPSHCIKINKDKSGKGFVSHMGHFVESFGNTNKYTHVEKDAVHDHLEPNVLLYFHGWNTPFEEAHRRAKAMEQPLNYLHGAESWSVIPIFWPCSQNDRIGETYFRDKKVAKESAEILAHKIHDLFGEHNEQTFNVHVLAHSMGCRVLSYIVPLLEHVVMQTCLLFAADLPKTIFTKPRGKYMVEFFDDVYVYHAKDDRALDVSFFANKLVKRLGDEGPDKLPLNAYAINCDALNFHYDTRNGHTYMLPHTVTGLPAIPFMDGVLRVNGNCPLEPKLVCGEDMSVDINVYQI